MRTETITPKELRKIMKLSITINVELGFYISLTAHYIDIDQFENVNPKKVKTYSFESKDLSNILILVSAYDRLFKRKLKLC